MHQSSRLVHPQDNAEGGEGHRSATASTSAPLLTPRKKGEDLNRLIHSLEKQYQLGLKVWDEHRSPVHRLHQTTADKVYRKIQHLFFSSSPALDDALTIFKTSAPFLASDQRLDVLYNILRSKTDTRSPVSLADTPLGEKSVPLKIPKASQQLIDDTPWTKDLFQNWRQNVATSLRTAAPDPGSFTDGEENDSVTYLPSRIPSGSPSLFFTPDPTQELEQATTRCVWHVRGRGRPPEGSTLAGKSTESMRYSQAEQLFETIPPSEIHKTTPVLRNKISLDKTRSFGSPFASQSTVDSSLNTVLSSQQTQPDTVNTSFTFDAENPMGSPSFIKRAISAAEIPLDDHDLLDVDTGFAQGDSKSRRCVEHLSCSPQSCDSFFTRGHSISEDEISDAPGSVKPLHTLSPSGLRYLSRQQLAHSPASGSNSSRLESTMSSLNQSFSLLQGSRTNPRRDKIGVGFQSASNSASPAPIKQEYPREQAHMESSSKVAHYIRDIPKQSLFVDEPSFDLQKIPYFVLFICQRVALECSISLTELVRSMDIASVCSDPETLWTSLLKCPKVARIKLRDSDRLWSTAKDNFEGFTFKGQINLRSKRSGPVFHLNLYPITPDVSCRFQRRFGADRFLYLNVPELDVKIWSGGTKEDLKQIRERWEEWLLAEHNFLYRTWRVFHIGPMKKAKTKSRHAEVTHRTRIILFATKGCGIDRDCSVGEMLDWFLPFSQNLAQPFCKVYARYDLGLSKTIPTHTFKPSQIFRVENTLANGEREATEFDDTSLKWGHIPGGQVMNDGCCTVSVGAALKIWKHYRKARGISGPLPSAFQGRIGGAKGLWMVSGESFTKDPSHLSTWIRINDSQLKFNPHIEDTSDSTFDPLRLTFEVSNYSSAPVHSELHISFVPIMADRGVPIGIIADYITERLDAERRELLERLSDPVKMYEYVHRNSSTLKDGSDVTWQAALPLALDEKIKLLLESGFSPAKLQVLAKNVLRFIRKQQLLQESKLKTPLGKAAYLYGVADPLGVLKPGEVHIQFSSSFVDEVTDEKYLSLKGQSLLVARQPAIRHSDIQKVRAIVHPDLSHLVDLVVFPSRGQYPLAGKLQGGDYDGDIFWVCWEERLVGPFQNAPAPMESPNPEQYGIKVSRERLQDIKVSANDASSIDEFLRIAFAFKHVPSLLGLVTTFLEKQSYEENRLSSPKLDRLDDIHDLLVDAAKQGYTFTMTDWQRYLRNVLRCDPSLKQPAYKEAMDACAALKDISDVNRKREKRYNYKQDHVIDHLYFEVVQPHNIDTMEKVQAILSSATEADADLLYPRDQLNALNDPIIDEELRRSQEAMVQLYSIWNANTHKDEKDGSLNDFSRVVEHLYASFQAIEPTRTDHPIVKMWLQTLLNSESCLWDKLRASILYARLPHSNAQTFVFQMAGYELAKLKAEKYPHSRSIVTYIRANMKPKATSSSVQDDDAAEEDNLTDELE